MKVTTVGIDLAKNVFQLHGVNEFGKPIIKKQIRREQMAEFFVNLPACLIGMEACGSAHHWARKLQGFGHTVKLMAPQFVKPYVKTNKNDAADAEAICEAVTRPNMRFVPIKNVAQQSVLALHRIRQQLMKVRIMQTNALRGLLYEFGIVLPEGHKKLLQSVQAELAKAQQDNRLPDMVVLSVQEQLKRVDALQDDIDQLDKRLAAMVKKSHQMLAVLAIPGVGPLTASALVSTTSDLSTFKSGRQFAAWLGLTPRQVGTGGKTQQLGISKRGDTYVRALLVNGARAVIGRSAHGSWIERLLQRRHFNVVVAALANKMARTVWAVLVKGQAFDQVKWNPTETAVA